MTRHVTLIGVFVLAACGSGSAENDSAGSASVGATPEPVVTIEYIAHASFLLTAPDGAKVLIDPYASRVWLGYDFPDGVTADAVLVTHPHYDHDAGVFRGADFPWPDTPLIQAPGTETVGSMRIIGVDGKHADPYGEEFGQINTMYVIETAGLRIAHLGDNGPLTDENVRDLGRVDILMIPGDALYHILSPEATEAAIEALDPRLIIPMHYRIGALETDPDSPSDLGDLGPWLEGRGPVLRPGGNTVELTATGLSQQRTYLVLEHSPAVPSDRAP